MTSTPQNGPKLSKQAIWRDPSSNGFYVWGGTMAYFDKSPAKEMWHFKVDGNGGGTWSKAPPANTTVFKQLVRSTETSYTQSKEVGYYFGGFAGSRTDTFITDEGEGIAIPGLISFNMTSGEAPDRQHEGNSVPWVLPVPITLAETNASTLLSFFYGGRSINRDSISGEVYVLSLPGRRRPPDAFLGGTDGSLGFPKSLTNPDPWKLGLAIFDMTEMRWSDRYDSQAQLYESPNVVKQWYAQGELDSVVWASEEVRALFSKRKSAVYLDVKCQEFDQTAAAPDDSTSDPSPTGEPNTSSATSTAEVSQSSQPPIGTIVGAAVGGAAGLALVVCLAVLFLKRKKRYQAAPQQEGGSGHFEVKGPAGTNVPHEVHTDHFNPVELPAEHGAAELSSAHGMHELEQPTARPSFSGQDRETPANRELRSSFEVDISRPRT
ncbi:kelch repeat protein [Colletotrichum acutatum]